MLTKNSHKTPYAFTREAKRLQLFDSFKKEQILCIIPQMAFEHLMEMPESDIGTIIKDLILFLMSDGNRKPEYRTDNREHQDCFEIILEITKRYMSSFKTRKKKNAVWTKKKITGKYVDDGSDMQELSELVQLRKNTLSFDIGSILKKPDDMPVFEDLKL